MNAKQMAADLYPSAQDHHQPLIEGLAAGVELFRQTVLPPNAGPNTTANLMRMIRAAYVPTGFAVTDMDSRLKADESAITLALSCGIEGFRRGLAAKARH